MRWVSFCACRYEAFSDGVIAIIITIMVLEIKVPHSAGFSDLAPLAPIFLSYTLSFIYLGIYWNNHHHMIHAAERVNGPILWANLHLLFWLSLVPFATAWMGENHFSVMPTALYGIILFMAGGAYFILQHAILAEYGRTSLLARAIGRDIKGKTSLVIYMAAFGITFVAPSVAQALYALVALIWIIPDRRIEKTLKE